MENLKPDACTYPALAAGSQERCAQGIAAAGFIACGIRGIFKRSNLGLRFSESVQMMPLARGGSLLFVLG